MGVTRKDILREIVQLTLSHPSKDRVTAIREGKSKDRVTTVREGKSKDRVTTVREGKNKEVAPSQVLYGTGILGVPRESTRGGSACSNHKTSR